MRSYIHSSFLRPDITQEVHECIRANIIIRDETGQLGQGQGQCRAGPGLIWGRAGGLWFEARQGHVWRSKDPCRTDLGQVHDRARTARPQLCMGHGITRWSIGQCQTDSVLKKYDNMVTKH